MIRVVKLIFNAPKNILSHFNFDWQNCSSLFPSIHSRSNEKNFVRKKKKDVCRWFCSTHYLFFSLFLSLFIYLSIKFWLQTFFFLVQLYDHNIGKLWWWKHRKNREINRWVGCLGVSQSLLRSYQSAITKDAKQ